MKQTEYYKAKQYSSTGHLLRAVRLALIKVYGHDDDLSARVHNTELSVKEYILEHGRCSVSCGDDIYTKDSYHKFKQGIDVDIDSHIYVYYHAQTIELANPKVL